MPHLARRAYYVAVQSHIRTSPLVATVLMKCNHCQYQSSAPARVVDHVRFAHSKKKEPCSHSRGQLVLEIIHYVAQPDEIRNVYLMCMLCGRTEYVPSSWQYSTPFVERLLLMPF